MGSAPPGGISGAKSNSKARSCRRFLMPGAPRRADTASALHGPARGRRQVGSFAEKANILSFLEIISCFKRWTFALRLCYNLDKIAELFGIMWS